MSCNLTGWWHASIVFCQWCRGTRGIRNEPFPSSAISCACCLQAAVKQLCGGVEPLLPPLSSCAQGRRCGFTVAASGPRHGKRTIRHDFVNASQLNVNNKQELRHVVDAMDNTTARVLPLLTLLCLVNYQLSPTCDLWTFRVTLASYECLIGVDG